jgi:hypothetical protein
VKKIVLILVILTLSLSARENPFSQQQMAEEPKLTLPKLTIQKPVKVEVIKKIEVKKLPIKIPKTEVKKTIPIVVKKPIIKPKKVKKKKVHKVVTKSKLIYNGAFTKISVYKNTIKIVTKDEKLQHFKLTHPNRLAVDFERFDVVPPFSKKIYTSHIKHLKVGHHDYFYRTTFQLAKNYRYKIMKKSYGYLIKLY